MFLKMGVYVCIHVYLQKPLTYSKLYLWDLHSFYYELVDSKEALKGMEKLGNFPLSWSKKSLTLLT